MASDNIVIEYEARIAQAEAALSRLEGDLKKVGKAQENSNKEAKKGVGIINSLTEETKELTEARNKATDPKQIKELNKQLDAQNKKVKELTTSTKSLGTKFNELANQLPFAGQIKQAVELGSSMVGLGGAAQKSSLGFQVLRIAIASTGIGLLIAAIVGLIQYFKRTDEGADKLANIMAYLGAAMDVVTGAVIGIGEGIVKAFSSVENFRQAMSDLGDFLVNSFVNRAKALVLIFEAIGLIVEATFESIKGNSVESAKLYDQATKQMVDASLQLATGVEDVRGKFGAFVDSVDKAATAAAEWQQRMNELEDKIRDNSVVIADNEKAISKLIIQAKNKQIADEESLALLEEAGKKEKANLALVLSTERQKLELIKERNLRESASINQDIKNGEKRRSISDALAQEEVDQRIKISQLEKSSDDLSEKIENRKDAKREEIFQNQLKRLGEEEVVLENFAKAEFIIGVTSAEKLEQELYKIKLAGLKDQRQLLIENSRSTVEVDKAILDIEVGLKIKTEKEKAAELKKIHDQEQADFFKMVDARLKAEDEAADARIKKEKETQEKIKQVALGSYDILKDLASGLYANLAQKRQQNLDEELRVSQEKTDGAVNALQNQLDKELITQDQFDRRKAVLDRKQEQKESEIKRKQFEQNRKAQLTQIAIDTAVAVVKTLTSLPYPASIIPAALAAAAGLAQAAIVSSQPTPKFKDGVINLQGAGTGTSDSIDAKLSKGESVMTARETHEHMPILQAIRNESLEDYIKNTHVLPALNAIDVKNNRARADRQSARDKKMDAIYNNMNLDTSNLERYTKNNKSVGINNTRQLAKDMAREMQINSNWFK